ncbi:hypothetical protein [Burkholderia pseudomallei]|uniref:hypothetical protein n=1 Tax=Burkholderia pseudomallei TaxID=28450 RepID=UPI000531E461|nr:hypothetical protein [Burkholderia pseudomallei]KGS21586.1 hypothetical protein X941_5547 [Burkholderia pseudomallei MSHR5569]
MRLSIFGRCGNCKSITSRVTGTSDDDSDDKHNCHVYQCRECTAKGLKPAGRERKKPLSGLPRHIEDALAAATYRMRSPDDAGFPRVVATIPTMGSIMLGGEGGEDVVERIERVWPQLDDVQINRVVRHIDAGCCAAIRAMTERPGRPKKRWITDGRANYSIQTTRDF